MFWATKDVLAQGMPNIQVDHKYTMLYHSPACHLVNYYQSTSEYIPVVTPRRPRSPPSTPHFTFEGLRQFKGDDMSDEQYQQMYCPTSSPMTKEKKSRQGSNHAVRMLEVLGILSNVFRYAVRLHGYIIVAKRISARQLLLVHIWPMHGVTL